MKWKKRPDDHDYDAAFDYLELVVTPDLAERIVDALQDAEVVRKKAKDILRAAGLPLLPVDDSEVAAVLEKVHAGEKISPVLLARLPVHARLIVADGYHRVCAAYHLDDGTEVHAHLI